MAGIKGFEPLLAASKAAAFTIWLYPYICGSVEALSSPRTERGSRQLESGLPLQFLSSLKDDKQIKIPFSRKASNEYRMALK